MASAGHCQNILNPTYRDVGTGVNRHPVGGFAIGPRHVDAGLRAVDRQSRAVAQLGPGGPLPVLTSCLYGGRGTGYVLGAGLGVKRGRVIAQVPLGVQRRLAPGAGRGHGLAIGVIDQVAGREHAAQVGQRRPVLSDHVTVLVDVDLTLDQLGLGHVANRNERSGDRQRLGGAVLGVPELRDPEPGALPKRWRTR